MDWESRYASGNAPWELGQASPPLLGLVRLYRDRLGRALVPGCGRGDDALAVAALGIGKHDVDVTGWDIAPTAVASALERNLAVAFEVRDALDPAATLADAGRFDAWIEHTFFCAIPPDLRPRYVEQAARLLHPDGLLLGVFYIGDRAKGPPYGASEDELRRLFSAHFPSLQIAPTTNSTGMWAGQEVTLVAYYPTRHSSLVTRHSSLVTFRCC